MQGRLAFEAFYGGQVFSHTIRAASMTISNEFLPHSAHAYFIKSGKLLNRQYPPLNIQQPLSKQLSRQRESSTRLQGSKNSRWKEFLHSLC